MKFSILVPTLGLREFELNRFFESLNKQTFKDFEIVVVSQINHEVVNDLENSWSSLSIKHICLEKKGLSYSRNEGLKHCSGEWVILADDDAWYPEDGLSKLDDICSGKYNIVLSQIYDPLIKESYKKYDASKKVISSKFELMSRSSIEIAFKRNEIHEIFDEDFGVGAKYVCGEEIDFLLKNFSKASIAYFPEVTVYHPKKDQKSSDAQIFAKGALYAKNFSRFTAFLITVRDKLKRRKTNSKIFWNGYNDYKSMGRVKE